jgi:hypothetical protein
MGHKKFEDRCASSTARVGTPIARSQLCGCRYAIRPLVCAPARTVRGPSSCHACRRCRVSEGRGARPGVGQAFAVAAEGARTVEAGMAEPERRRQAAVACDRVAFPFDDTPGADTHPTAHGRMEQADASPTRRGQTQVSTGRQAERQTKKGPMGGISKAPTRSARIHSKSGSGSCSSTSVREHRTGATIVLMTQLFRSPTMDEPIEPLVASDQRPPSPDAALDVGAPSIQAEQLPAGSALASSAAVP